MTENGVSSEVPNNSDLWYIMMTLSGEPSEDKDYELAKSNEFFWNALIVSVYPEWIGQVPQKTANKLHSNGHQELSEETLAELDAAARGRGTTLRILQDLAPGSVCFKEHRFETSLNLNGFVFPMGLYFDDCIFDDRIELQEAVIRNNLIFQKCLIEGPVAMANLKCRGGFYLIDTEIGGGVDLRSCEIDHSVKFHDSVFKARFTAMYSKFGDEFSVQSSKFNGYAKFGKCVFSGVANFAHSSFEAGAAFDDAKFQAATSFRRVTVGKYVSSFLDREKRVGENILTFFNTALHESTDWSGIVWPAVPKDQEIARDHRLGYERLKLMMDSQRKFHDEHMFLRKELKCREVEDPRSISAIVSRIFGIVSDYGWSFVRPLMLFAVFWIGCGTALFFFPSVFQKGHRLLTIGESFAISASNMFAFLGFNRTFLADETKLLSSSGELLSAGQTFIGVLTVFCIGLALRNRFRMK